MKLFTEEAQGVKMLTESVGGKKKLYIEGVFCQAETKNRNGRVYPLQTLSNAVNFYIENFVNKRRAVGELGHSATPTINYDRVSHIIESITRKGNDFYGRAKITNTPMGKIVQNLHDEGVVFGVSSRAVGSLRPTNEGVNVVGDDLMFSTVADIVHDPSCTSAFVEGIMEGKEWYYDVSRKEWLLEDTRKKVNKLVETRQFNEQKRLELFNNFINSI
jgi:Prohead core protein serine protease